MNLNYSFYSKNIFRLQSQHTINLPFHPFQKQQPLENNTLPKMSQSLHKWRALPLKWNRSNSIPLVVILFIITTATHLAKASPQKPDPNVVRVNKCCEKFEVLYENQCTHVNQTRIADICTY